MKTHPFSLALLLGGLLPLSALAAPQTYKIDSGHTQIHWEADHQQTSTNRGRFSSITGSVVLDREAKSGKVDVSIDMLALSTGIANFDKHLSSPDFFDTAKFATATFVGDQVVFEGEKVSSVSGTLTLLGKSNPVTLKAVRFNCYENKWTKKQACGGDFETTLQRSQWGMEYGLPGIPDNVLVRIQAEAGAE